MKKLIKSIKTIVIGIVCSPALTACAKTRVVTYTNCRPKVIVHKIVTVVRPAVVIRPCAVAVIRPLPRQRVIIYK